MKEAAPEMNPESHESTVHQFGTVAGHERETGAYKNERVVGMQDKGVSNLSAAWKNQKFHDQILTELGGVVKLDLRNTDLTDQDIQALGELNRKASEKGGSVEVTVRTAVDAERLRKQNVIQNGLTVVTDEQLKAGKLDRKDEAAPSAEKTPTLAA